MNVSIIISGNLTGFSRFYASPDANDIYNEAKFDFDYRNYLTFITPGEKAYAVSFSPKVIAVSLVTRILDSFRRPGILVVTALVPRHQLVAGTLNASEKGAIYRLLNEVNDKFYEKNFVNGVVNPNPAMLRQDNYSEILKNYTLASDRLQKNINGNIDIATPNQHIGYVAAPENDMPKYLGSLMRKSYNGYHHVFFAQNAPQNIDEPTEEVVTYRVRIENGNRHVPGEVRLTDKITTAAPEPGERPLANTNFTYAQVLNGEAGADIVASIENETIVLTFRFPKEEKTIYFKFFSGADEVPLQVIRPHLVEANGTSIPLPTDCIKFYGKEIYGHKILKSGNPDYTVEPSSSGIDLQRYPDGSTISVYVSKGYFWKFDPKVPTIKPVNITLTNKFSGGYINLENVTGPITEKLPSNPQEWEMRIDSDYYETVICPANSPFKLERKKVSPVVVPAGGGNHGGGNFGGGGGHYGGGSHPGRVERPGQPNLEHDRDEKTLSGGNEEEAKETFLIDEDKKKRLIQYGMYVVAGIICCVAGWWIYTLINGGKSKEDGPIPQENMTSTTVTFTLEDASLNQRNIDRENLDLLDIIIDPVIDIEGIKIEDYDDKFTKIISYQRGKMPEMTVKAVLETSKGKFVLASELIQIDTLKENNEKTIQLSVKNSELTYYRNLSAGDKESINKNDFDKAIQRLRSSEGNGYTQKYADYLVELYNGSSVGDPEAVGPPATPPEKEDKEPKGTKEAKKTEKSKDKDMESQNSESEKGDDSSKGNKIRKELDDPSIQLTYLDPLNQEKFPKPNAAEKERIKALIKVLKNLKDGVCPESADNLSKKQGKIVNNLIGKHNELLKLPDGKEKDEKLKSFSTALKAKNKKGEHSIYTAQEALKVKT